jgi:hypothetical protein
MKAGIWKPGGLKYECSEEVVLHTQEMRTLNKTSLSVRKLKI